jgi:myosin-5
VSSRRVSCRPSQNLLLEKARIVYQPQGERNYHIFFQIQQSTDLKIKCGLNGDPKAYNYSGKSGIQVRPTI